MDTTTMIRMEIRSDDPYRAGACNIGPAELARRRRSAAASTIATLVVAVAAVALGAPPLARLVVAPLAIATAVAWLQVVKRFCVGFGAIGVRNFGALGGASRVEDDIARAADRRHALMLIGQGVVLGAAATLFLVLLPL